MSSHNPELVRMGFALLALGFVQGLLGALLTRRSAERRHLVLPAAACMWSAALGSGATGFAYLYAATGFDHDFAYRLSALSWVPVAAYGHLVLELGYRDRPWRRPAIIAFYLVAAAILVVTVATDLVQAGPPTLSPYVDHPGPLGDPLVGAGAGFIAVVLGLMLAAHRRMLPEERVRIRPLYWGGVLSALTGVALLLAGWVGQPTDQALAIWGTLFLTVGVAATLNRQGVFEVDVDMGHLAMVLLWTASLAAAQWVLWTWLVPPLPPGGAVVLTFLVIVLIAYAGMPAGRRTLDSIDALVLSRRRRRPTLQACMRAASASLDMEQMILTLSRSLVRDGGISRVTFLLEEEDGTYSSARTLREEDPVRLPAGAPLADWLARSQRTLTRDAARNLADPERKAHLAADLDLLGAELAVPMVCKGRLLGILALGPLASGATYEEEDLLLLGALSDQAAVAVENARLFRSATTDGLTGLLQRTYFMGRLREEMERARRYRRALAVIVLDIDHFKRVNDRFGHAEGDRVLREISTQLRRSLRSSDVACRYGGEEFVILLVETPGDLAFKVAERLRERVAALSLDRIGEVTVSLGVAEMRGEQSPETLIQQADVAMYQAKRGGRNRVVAWRTRARAGEAEAAPEMDAPENPPTG